MVSTTISRWRGLPTEHRRWIVVNALVVTAFTNFVLNASSPGSASVPSTLSRSGVSLRLERRMS